MNLDNIGQQARTALNSEKAEQVSDQVLDAAAKTASDRLGAQHQDTIAQVREAADRRIGTE